MAADEVSIDVYRSIKLRAATQKISNDSANALEGRPVVGESIVDLNIGTRSKLLTQQLRREMLPTFPTHLFFCYCDLDSYAYVDVMK